MPLSILKASNLKKRLALGMLIVMLAWLYLVAVFNTQLSSLPIFLQFAITTLPFWIFPAVLISKNLKDGLQKSVGALLLLSWGSLVTPEYSISLTGQLGTNLLSTASIDAVVASVWAGLGINGFLLWVFTYAITGIALFFGAIALLNPKQLKNSLGL